ncbi:MAG: DUF4838 domain-containing protein [Planctomycetota bacterium]
MRLAAVAACVALLLVASRATGLTLCREGRSGYVIVLPDRAEVWEQTAARELQDHLEQVTGAKLPIRREKEVEEGAPQILVGASDRGKQLLADAGAADPGPDGICLKTVGDVLVLTGPPPRGALYAMYTFLEDVVGCRWWTSTEASIPKRPTLVIPDLNTVHASPLVSRETFYRDAFNCPFAVRLKLNGHFMQIPPEYGGNVRITGWCHTFFQILPPSAYFAEHPDWYSEIEGKRSADHTQLCLANRAMREEFVRVALERLRAEQDPKILSVSQNDWGGRCQCADCKALEEREESPSGPLVQFVNAVAERIEKEFPEVLVETLAYQYTRRPPKHVKPRHNVLIRLCSIECSFSQPLAAGPHNEKFREDVRGWSAIAPQLYVWNYVTNFSNFLLPHPNMRALAEDVRFLVANKTLGLFEQGDAYSTTGDFIRLRTWVLAHLLWDPSRDQAALIREFAEGYYGPAAPYLLQYLDLAHDAVEESGAYLRCFTADTSSWLTLDVLNRATRLFDQAAAAVADDPVLARRVDRERLPLDHVWLNRYHALAREAKQNKSEFLGPEDPVAACREWIEKNGEFDNRFYGEQRPFDQYAENLARRFRPPAPPPDLCKGLPEDEWIDVQDNQFELHGLGAWAAWVDDETASDKGAARMPGNHVQWAVQYPLDVPDEGPWRCYVFARCDAKAKRGRGAQIGIYDSDGEKTIGRRDAAIEELAGKEYVPMDLGVHVLRPAMYVWIAPWNNPEEVEAVYVDRVVLVRQRRQVPP